MNTILVATDFSEMAQNAADYAVEMARHTDASVLLVNAYQLVFTGENGLVNMQEMDVVKDIAKNSMKAELERLQASAPGLKIDTFLGPGGILNTIAELCDQVKPMIVVLGSSGASGSLLWGSTSSAAFRELKMPVLAIPAGHRWEPVKNLCFAADYHTIDDAGPVNAVAYWLNKFHAKLFMLHIDKPGGKLEPSAVFQQAFAPLDPVYINSENDDVEKGVQAFLESHSIDWLVIMPHKHSFFERLFSIGSTKKLAHINSHPILAVHG
ncbi:MAG: universal stress protein [Ferruginibacter sp.]